MKTAIEHYEAALKEAFPSGATCDVFHHWNEARKLIANSALDKMAENAKELGLDYTITQTGVGIGKRAEESYEAAKERGWVGLSDHRLMEQPVQQEPVAYRCWNNPQNADGTFDTLHIWASLKPEGYGNEPLCTRPQALEQVEQPKGRWGVHQQQALSRALEQPAQHEPMAFSTANAFAWGDRQSERVVKLTRKAQPEYGFTEPVYTRPQAREWVGLTDAEWMNIVNKNHAWFGVAPDEVAHEVCKLTEAKLKEKNT